jgi:hypothetical protein
MNEPTTVLTDYALAALSFVLAWRLARSSRCVPSRLWAASFVALGVAAASGGTWHGISPEDAPAVRYHLWSITYVAIGLADSLILAGAVQAALSSGPKAVALVLLTGRFVAYAVLVVTSRDFRYVSVEYAVTLLFLFCFGLDLLRRREPATRFVLAGALVSLAGGLVLSLRFSLHPLFNHIDLFHVIQMAGIVFFYRAGLLLRDR